MDPNTPDDGFSPAPAPVGMEAPAVALPQGPAPEPRFEESVCLKGAAGRCEHLWQVVTNFSHGNPGGTFKEGEEPRAVHRSCIRSPSEEMDLAGLVVFSCNAHSDPNFRKNPKPFVFPKPEDTTPAVAAPVVKMPANPDHANLPLVRLKPKKENNSQ